MVSLNGLSYILVCRLFLLVLLGAVVLHAGLYVLSFLQDTESEVYTEGGKLELASALAAACSSGRPGLGHSSLRS